MLHVSFCRKNTYIRATARHHRSWKPRGKSAAEFLGVESRGASAGRRGRKGLGFPRWRIIPLVSKSPKWGCGTPSKWPLHGFSHGGYSTNHKLIGKILQVGSWCWTYMILICVWEKQLKYKNLGSKTHRGIDAGHQDGHISCTTPFKN